MYRRAAIASTFALLAGCGSIVGGSESDGNPLGEQPENPSVEIWSTEETQTGRDLFLTAELNQAESLELVLEGSQTLTQIIEDVDERKIASATEEPKVVKTMEIVIHAEFDGFSRDLGPIYVPFDLGRENSASYTPEA